MMTPTPFYDGKRSAKLASTVELGFVPVNGSGRFQFWCGRRFCV